MKKKFSWKAFISMGLSYSFIVVLITGIVLYLAPVGRIAHWTNWTIFGFTKEGWAELHMVFTLLFVILLIFHLFSMNWKIFLSYLKNKKSKGLYRKKELYLSTIFAILVFLGTVYSIPPFSSVIDFGDYLTKTWENKNVEPPVPRAELLTLNELSEQLDDVSIDKIENGLNNSKIVYNSKDETLLEIAESNNLTPIEVYDSINIHKSSRGSGQKRGIGRMTLMGFADENGKDADELLRILKEHGINARKNQTFKKIALENGVSHREVYDLVK